MRATGTKCLIAIVTYTFLAGVAPAQQASETRSRPANAAVLSNAPVASASSSSLEATERERVLIDRIEKLERRLAELESRGESKTVREALEAPLKSALGQPVKSDATTHNNPASDTQQISKEDRGALDFLRDTTFNVSIDGYYGYNFNKPIGRINLLRAYDVTSNSFSLNQAAIVIERTPNIEAGRRFGLRLDLQYGQATETVQGNASNELRPQVYRPVWQALGTYVAPIGKGLTVDFGKFGSSLGYETNFTKDNLNYSRSYYFNFLPFYHFGFRAKYPINDKLALMYHVMNGVQQSEDFNGFKSQQFALILTPTKKLSWQVNYYFGQEQRDTVPELNPGFANLPTQPGLSSNVIRPVPDGRLHILDTYASWNVTGKLTLVGEADYVVNRLVDSSAPSHVSGGVVYARYQFAPKFTLTARGEYLSDRGGLFSGVTQALKETTLTADFKLADGLLVRGEWRRDFSNRPFFLSDTPGLLQKDQQTATVGLIWWMGQKDGAW